MTWYGRTRLVVARHRMAGQVSVPHDMTGQRAAGQCLEWRGSAWHGPSPQGMDLNRGGR